MKLSGNFDKYKHLSNGAGNHVSFGSLDICSLDYPL